MCFHFESFMIDSFNETEFANYNEAHIIAIFACMSFIYFLCSIVSSWWTISCISINTPWTSIFLSLKYYHIQSTNNLYNIDGIFPKILIDSLENYYHSKLFWTNSLDIMPKLAINCRIMISFWIHLTFIRSIFFYLEKLITQ